MEFGQAIPLQLRPKYSEGSSLASDRDSRNNSLLWKKQRNVSRQENGNTVALQKISREVAKMRRRIVGGGGGLGTDSIQQFKITTIPSGKKDYFMAKSWDGTTLGSEEISVAKQFVYRPSITAVTILGTNITYVYSDDNHRTSSDGVNPDQNEELYWPFEVDSGTTNGIVIISELSTPTGVLDADGNPIYFLDMTQHVWAKYS